MILALLFAGTQVPVPQYNDIIVERPLLSKDYPTHYTHYRVDDSILNFNAEYWSDLRTDEKIDLIRTLSKVNDSSYVSKIYKELFNKEEDVQIKKEILCNMVYSKPVTRTQTWLKSLIKTKDFKRESFIAFASHASLQEIQTIINNDTELLILAAQLGKVTDPKKLIAGYKSLKSDNEKTFFIKQLAFLKYDQAYQLCNTFFLKLKFTSASCSENFLIKQSQTREFAQAALVRMKELGWSKQFNNRAMQIVTSNRNELKAAACEILVLNKSNIAFLIKNLNNLPTPAALIVLDLFKTIEVPVNLQNDFCKLNHKADIVNITKVQILEDQAIRVGMQSASQVLQKTKNPELIKVALRYLGVVKYKINNLPNLLNDRNPLIQQGAVFYLASTAQSGSQKIFGKYLKSKDMLIRQAFFDGVAHNPKIDFSKVFVPGLKNRSDNLKDMQPNSTVRAYMMWALMKSEKKPVDQCFYEMKQLITTKLVKVPMSDNVFDPFYVRGTALLCLAKWANSGAKEARRFYQESLEFIEWQKEEGLEYSNSFDQIVDMAKAIANGTVNNKSYTYSKALSIKLVNRPLK